MGGRQKDTGTVAAAESFMHVLDAALTTNLMPGGGCARHPPAHTRVSPAAGGLVRLAGIAVAVALGAVALDRASLPSSDAPAIQQALMETGKAPRVRHASRGPLNALPDTRLSP